MRVSQIIIEPQLQTGGWVISGYFRWSTGSGVYKLFRERCAADRSNFRCMKRDTCRYSRAKRLAETTAVAKGNLRVRISVQRITFSTAPPA
jgi:hypothetical protein